ncbi:hypothetical protein [Pedosphaera parvula]|nr:hypothetical protein [Pedosphaera parvula]
MTMIRNYLPLARRYLAILAMALWMGGFTFYSLIVIPTASKVLGGEREVGFVTQQVTNWLNLIGIGALLILLWNTLAERKKAGFLVSYGLPATWLVMVLSLIGLFFAHAWIDQLLDTANHKVLSYSHFFDRHRLYMIIATIQWCSALAHLLLILLAGQKVGGLGSQRETELVTS